MSNLDDHRVAMHLLQIFSDRGYLTAGDDCGGSIRLEFGTHFWNAVSLDRIDNSLPHFPV